MSTVELGTYIVIDYLCLYCYSDMLLGEDIERQSICELEVDVVAADILNRLEVGGKDKAV